MDTRPIPSEASLYARAAMALSDGGITTDGTLSIYRELVHAVEAEGPECIFCRQRGLNCGRFAQPYGGGHAHIGCLEDARRGQEIDRQDHDED